MAQLSDEGFGEMDFDKMTPGQQNLIKGLGSIGISQDTIFKLEKEMRETDRKEREEAEKKAL